MSNRSRRAKIDPDEHYVSRAAYKLDSVLDDLKLDFRGKTVLDVGSSTGGFSDYALRHGAAKVIAVDKGSNQIHQSLKLNSKLELHEKTDIRKFVPKDLVDIVLIDVSFVSLKQILPYIVSVLLKPAVIVAMAKPQFETRDSALINNGIIKNERIRRKLLGDLESWLRESFLIDVKVDSKIHGLKGNRERFYKLEPIHKKPLSIHQNNSKLQ